MKFTKYFRWLFPAKSSTNESINIVNSIAKAKKLHKELILYAHPDRPVSYTHLTLPTT